MHPTLEQARHFQDLLALNQHDAPYVYTSLFSDKGFRARSLSKKKFKLLRRTDEAIRPMLRPEERVQFLTFGSGVSFLESYFLGWVMYYINQRAIVLTNHRVLLLQIDSRRRPRDLRAQLQYGAIAKISRTLLGNTKVKLRNGHTHIFTRVPGADRKYLAELVRELRAKLDPITPASATGIEDLCPHCYQPVPNRPDTCPGCQGPFKSARKAGLLSLLFPGFGDIYIGHWKFAIIEIAVAALVWVGYFLPDPEFPRTAMEIAVGALVLFLFMHGIDALGTWYIAKKGIHPVRRHAT
jgi:hypothetical protein